MMLREGVFNDPVPEAIFGWHTAAGMPSGTIGYRAGPMMAGSDTFRIDIKGRQTHGSMPWAGVDPIVIASQVVGALQTIVSRQVDITALPAVVTIGRIEGGVRANIIPESVTLHGTLRTFDAGMREQIVDRMRLMTGNIAQASGAEAALTLSPRSSPVVMNDPALTEKTVAALERLVGRDRVVQMSLKTTSEDFAFYAQQAKGFFFFIGVTPPGPDVEKAPANHSPFFYIDEPALAVATRAILTAALSYLQAE
jgi:amidohydrolase